MSSSKRAARRRRVKADRSLRRWFLWATRTANKFREEFAEALRVASRGQWFTLPPGYKVHQA